MRLDDILNVFRGDTEEDRRRRRFLNDPRSVPMRQRPMGRPQFAIPSGPPQWAMDLPRAPSATSAAPVRRMPDFPVGPGGVLPPAPYEGLTAEHVRPLPATHPGAHSNFADYANAVLGQSAPQSVARDNEPWRQPERIPLSDMQAGVEQRRDTNRPLMVGEAAPRLGLEPESATRRATADLENEAWNAAMERVRARRAPDPTGLRAIGRRELDALRSSQSREQVIADSRLGLQDIQMRIRGLPIPARGGAKDLSGRRF